MVCSMKSISSTVSLLTCKPHRVLVVIIVFVFWTTMFGWITLMSKPKRYSPMSKDFRDVPELRNPPTEVTSTERVDVKKMLEVVTAAGFLRESDEHIFDRIDPNWPFLLEFGDRLIKQNVTSKHLGDRFAFSARQYALYDPNELDISELLQMMSNQPIEKLEEVTRGTQLKLKLYLEDYGPTMFKAKRYDRSYETSPNQFYFSDYERHNAEIAAFHLDRLLGWYRAPPVVGRMVNVSGDLFRLAPSRLRHTFFQSPAQNWCFYGHCKYYCDTTNAFCGNPHMLEGSLATFLPPNALTTMEKIKSPWRRSYNKHTQAAWESDPKYCENVKKSPAFRNPRRLLDIIDTHVLDFIMGNMDRHHYLFYKGFPSNDTFHLHFDHGRGFGRISHDELSILAPIVQCCLIRYTTFYKLVTFYRGSHPLSEILRKSLSRDPVAPVLADGHYVSVDRRVAKTLVALTKCVFNHKVSHVIIKDGT